jgi:anti-sigma factor RsiW
MKVTRDVILDLLPLYLSGEASTATRALVDEYLEQDAELAARVRLGGAESFPRLGPAPPPELELESLRRTRGLLRWQRWLFALGGTFTALALATEVGLENRHFHVRLLIFDYPGVFGTFLLIALACWIGYVTIRRRLRGAP